MLYAIQVGYREARVSGVKPKKTRHLDCPAAGFRRSGTVAGVISQRWGCRTTELYAARLKSPAKSQKIVSSRQLPALFKVKNAVFIKTGMRGQFYLRPSE